MLLMGAAILVACGGDDRRPSDSGSDTTPTDTGTDTSVGDTAIDSAVDSDVPDEGTDADDPCALVDCEAGLICNPDDGMCVQCLTSDECGGAECVDNTCPAESCETDEECTSTAASHCGEEMTCEPCTLTEQCEHIDSGLACLDGTCVEPAEDNTCTPCESDADCGEGACIPMRFDGELLDGSWCAARAPEGVGECPNRPFRNRIRGRANTAGTLIADFCSIDENTTTCEAVRDGLDVRACEDPAACGEDGIDDALCVEGACTYRCETSDECRLGDSCEASPTMPEDVLFCQ